MNKGTRNTEPRSLFYEPPSHRDGLHRRLTQAAYKDKPNSIQGFGTVILVLICLLTPLTSVSWGYSFDGTGEPNDPYQIATAEQLISIGSDPNLLSRNYVLVNDIDLDPNLPGGRVFDRAVIASEADPFAVPKATGGFEGTFDGNGHIIRNLTIRSTTRTYYLSLFCCIGSEGRIHHLGLEDVRLTGTEGIGGLAGNNDGRIDHCSVTGKIYGTAFLGGLVSDNWDGSIAQCQVAVTVTGSGKAFYLGGMVAFNLGTIANCRSDMMVIGGKESYLVGGLVAFNVGTIANSQTTSTVTAGERSEGLGGLVGGMGNQGDVVGWPGEGAFIANCYATGNIFVGKESWWVGGLVGFSTQGAVTNCFATGTVTACEDCYYLGGLVGLAADWGRFSTITNCYATGSVTCGNSLYQGGLVGWGRPSQVRYSFWDMETSGLGWSAGGTGLSTAEIQDANTFLTAGWDWIGESVNGTSDLWQTPDGRGYPILTVFSETYQPHKLAGNGTPDDPYRLASAEDLGAVCHYDGSACYRLAASVDLSGITWSAAPIPDLEGTFEGAGFVVHDLTIRGGGHLGLFGTLGPHASVTNIGVADANIIGADYGCCLGALVAKHRGNASQCFATGRVSGGDYAQYVGGLVGYQVQASIRDCYSTAKISSGKNAGQLGGLVGISHGGTISNCYACGSVARDESTGNGGLVGWIWKVTITHCYFLATSDGGGPDNRLGTVLNSTQMKQQGSFAGWDFVGETANGTEDIWTICEGKDYPRLKLENAKCNE